MEDRIEDVLHGFEEVQDPRIERHKLYPLNEILLVTLCAVISGCETYEDIADFGEVKLDSLRILLLEYFARTVYSGKTCASLMRKGFFESLFGRDSEQTKCFSV